MQNNLEPFDIWSEAKFVMWSNTRYDFELIAEFTRYKRSVSRCLEILDTVNFYIKNNPKNVFFDGTIKCLKYLVKNKYLSISDLPQDTPDSRYLYNLLEKYANRLDITDILSDIEEPTLRVMLLEYPQLLNDVLSDNPIAGHLLGKAMLKNNITNAKSLTEKVDDGTSSIEVDSDKNSKEAMKCKIIYLGLRLNNKKLMITKSSTNIIREFQNLTDDVVENENYTKSVFNTLYVSFYGSDEWNKEKKTHLSGCDTLYLNFQLLFLPNNHMSMIYDIFLSKYVDQIGKKYFGDEYRPEGFIASLAIKMVVVILIFRTDNFLPEGEKEETDVFSGGAFLRGLNYAVKETKDPTNPFELKEWFIDYFCEELDKRLAFIKMQIKNNVAVVNMGGRERVIYLPVFETFRFFCKRDALLPDIIKLLKNKEIPNQVKDEIFINFVLNIQKIIAQKQENISEDEQKIKNTFILLISMTFEGLYRNITNKIKGVSKKYYEYNDFIGDAKLSVIELILQFDLSKNSSFIGYLTNNLFYKMKASGRMNKTDTNTDTENTLEEDFFESIPDTNDFINSIEDEKNLKKIMEHIENLPEKEKEAVRKMVENNKTLTDTERKAKNRGLNKIRKMMENS